MNDIMNDHLYILPIELKTEDKIREYTSYIFLNFTTHTAHETICSAVSRKIILLLYCWSFRHSPSLRFRWAVHESLLSHARRSPINHARFSNGPHGASPCVSLHHWPQGNDLQTFILFEKYIAYRSKGMYGPEMQFAMRSKIWTYKIQERDRECKNLSCRGFCVTSNSYCAINLVWSLE